MSFIHSIMMYLSFLPSNSEMYDIFQYNKQYFNDLKNKFDGNKSNIDQTYRYQSVHHLIAF